jgi:phosphoserine aminotransferase
MKRAYNFCAGPAALPLAVLERAREELLDWRGHGLSVMEMSHRSKEVVAIADKAEADLRALLGAGEDYAVLFLQGGATAQFAAVPLNLLRGAAKADYVNTGQWSTKAIAEARKYCEVNVAASTEDRNFMGVPDPATWRCSPDAAYLHYTPNETIGGVEYPWIPDVAGVPLVADMSSTILSRPLDVARFGAIYAGAQKNIGPAGLVIVLVRRELLGQPDPLTPAVLDWTLQAKNGSMYNTPPVYSIYLAGLVFEWLLEQGGLAAMERRNRAKAEALYAYIDASGFYANPVDRTARSWMNVPFTIADAALEKPFLAEAKARGLLNLEGHRSVGGMRASIYNALGMDAVEALVAFMREFAAQRG